MPRLSVAICCSGRPSEFEDTLVSVLQNRPRDCEVLVVHSHAYDDPYGLGEEVRFERVAGRGGLTQLANRALRAAAGDIVHVLSTRMTAVEGWTDAAVELLENEDLVAVSPLIVAPTDKRVVAAGVKYGLGGSRQLVGAGLETGHKKLAKLQVAAPTIEAGFYRRDVLLAVGGFSELLGDDAADVELGRLLAALELKTAIAVDSIVHELHPDRRNAGITRGRALERLFWRQHSAARSVLGLIAHGCVATADVLLRLPRGEALTTLIGRTIGLLHAGTKESFADTIEQARAAIETLLNEESSTLSITRAREQISERSEQTARRRAA